MKTLPFLLSLLAGKNFAIAQMVLCLCASLSYFYARDFRRGIYWFAAAVITGSVTF